MVQRKSKQISLRDSNDSFREIKKHSSIVQMGGYDTMIQRKLFNATIWLSKDQLKRNPNQIRFYSELGILMRLTGYKDTKNEDIKEALRTLRRTEFEYNILHKDKESRGNFSYLSDVEIQSFGRGHPAYVYWEYPSRVLKVIQDPEIYVRLNLLITRDINNKHSLVLYEYLMDYIGL